MAIHIRRDFYGLHCMPHGMTDDSCIQKVARLDLALQPGAQQMAVPPDHEELVGGLHAVPAAAHPSIRNRVLRLRVPEGKLRRLPRAPARGEAEVLRLGRIAQLVHLRLHHLLRRR